MTAEATLAALRARMLGRAVVRKRLFLYTLQLYLEPGPGAERGLEVWCEPAWQLVGPTGVLAGSGTIDFDPEAEDRDARQRIASIATEVLRGQRVEDVAVDGLTHQLEIRLSGGLAVRTFVADPTEREQWLIRDPVAEVGLRGTPEGMCLEAAPRCGPAADGA